MMFETKIILILAMTALTTLMMMVLPQINFFATNIDLGL
ncbi:MAG: hypothetical protein CM15mP109_07190 [Candidatus Dadabacteria bacterium]|nr:MAG: hypothetical protein CM15mP109_07190 [Candidatus Dadabacteria bacterium]